MTDKKPRKISNWILFLKKHMSGKKFKSRADVNTYMRQLSVEFKKGK
jgi:hypothetical protein